MVATYGTGPIAATEANGRFAISPADARRSSIESSSACPAWLTPHTTASASQPENATPSTVSPAGAGWASAYARSLANAVFATYEDRVELGEVGERRVVRRRRHTIAAGAMSDDVVRGPGIERRELVERDERRARVVDQREDRRRVGGRHRDRRLGDLRVVPPPMAHPVRATASNAKVFMPP